MREYTILNAVNLFYFVSLCWLLYFIKLIRYTKSLPPARLLLFFRHYFSNILPTDRCGHIAVPYYTPFSCLRLMEIVLSSLPYQTYLGIVGATKSVDETWDLNKPTSVWEIDWARMLSSPYAFLYYQTIVSSEVDDSYPFPSTTSSRIRGD